MKQKLCPLCLATGKETPICSANGVYCWHHMQTEQWIYHFKQQRKRKSKT